MNCFSCHEDYLQLHDVWMLQLLQQGNLAQRSTGDAIILQLDFDFLGEISKYATRDNT